MGRRLTLVGIGSALALWMAPPALATPDPAFQGQKQWAPQVIGAPQACAAATGPTVKIGVVDTGADAGHEDLVGKVVASTNCIGSNGNANACAGSGPDDNGHGTHVSGIAAADTNNGKGIAAVAPDAQLVVAKALDNTGGGSTDDVNAGIHWVVDHGARVVNLSLGSDLPTLKLVLGEPLSDGIEYAWNQGAVVVLAAGNDATPIVGSQNYGDLDALVVGATDRYDQVASYSSSLSGTKWGLVAPGGKGSNPPGPDDVLSTWPGSTYKYLAGTSMAAPHVSGTAALLLSAGLSPQATVNRILDTANKSVACGSGCHGRLDTAKALGQPSSRPGSGAPPAPLRVPPPPGSSGGSTIGAPPAGGATSTVPGAPPGSTTSTGATGAAAGDTAATGADGAAAGRAHAAGVHHGGGDDQTAPAAVAGALLLGAAGGLIRVARARAW